MDNPYQWRENPEWGNDRAASYTLLRDGDDIGRLTLTRDLPFHAAILNEVCLALYGAEVVDGSELDGQLDLLGGDG